MIKLAFPNIFGFGVGWSSWDSIVLDHRCHHRTSDGTNENDAHDAGWHVEVLPHNELDT